MALQGTLDTFGLADVLHLLADTAKTGCVRVDSDWGGGLVWVRDGSIVGAHAERADRTGAIDEILFELLRHEQGSFRFDDGIVAEHGIEPQEIGAALAAATSLLEEWRELEKIVPSTECVVVLAPALAEERVTIDAGQWATLARIGPGTEIATLADDMGLNELEITRVVCDLVESCLVEIRPAPLPRRMRSTAPRRTRGEVPLTNGEIPPMSGAG